MSFDREIKILRRVNDSWTIVEEPLLHGETRGGLSRNKGLQSYVSSLLEEVEYCSSGNILSEALKIPGSENLGGGAIETLMDADSCVYFNPPLSLGRGLKFTKTCKQASVKQWETGKAHLVGHLMDTQLLTPLLYLIDGGKVRESIESGLGQELFDSPFKQISRPVEYEGRAVEIQYPSWENTPDVDLIILGEPPEVKGLPYRALTDTQRAWLMRNFPTAQVIEIRRAPHVKTPFHLSVPNHNLKGTHIPISGEAYRGYYSYCVLQTLLTIKEARLVP